MKLNAAFLALALAIASVSAAPVPSAEGESVVLNERELPVGALARLGSAAGKGMGKVGTGIKNNAGDIGMIGMTLPMMMPQNQNGKRSMPIETDFHPVDYTTVLDHEGKPLERRVTPAPSRAPSIASSRTSTFTPEVAEPKGNAYQEHASSINNGWGMTNGIGQMVAAGINLNTSQQPPSSKRSIKDDHLIESLQRRVEPVRAPSRAPSIAPSTTGSTASFHTANESPVDAPKYKTSDFLSSGNNMFGTAAMGMNIAAAANNNQNAKREAPWLLPMMMMGGGPSVSVSNSHQNAQSVGNGNAKQSGGSSGVHRRSIDEDDELQRRLFSFDSQSYHQNQQAVGNQNQYVSGASSGIGKRLFDLGISNQDVNEQSVGNGNSYVSGASSGIGKRLFSFSDESVHENQQAVGNENHYVSGASSGIFKKREAPWLLPMMMMGGGPSVSVSNSHQNAQAVGNQNSKQSGASSGVHRRSEVEADDENLLELQRRLFSFSHQEQDYNAQSVGNGNMYMSGAHSGIGKRLLSFGSSSEDINQQSVGNGNRYKSGATSGVSGAGMKSLNAGTAAGLPAKKRLISFGSSSEHINEQSVGNGNQYKSGASSGVSGAGMRMLNAGTAAGL